MRSWQSSLSNLENRLRRSLGIAGPVNLGLEDPPRLVPVALADDWTRPGATGTDYRGRRFAIASSTGGAIAIGARGCVWFAVNSIINTSANIDKGGVVLDELEVSWWTAGALERIVTEVRMSSSFELQPGASIRDGFMVDPIGTPGGSFGAGSFESSPMNSGQSLVVAAGGFGARVWEQPIANGGGANATLSHRTIKLDYFLREQQFIVIGNSAILAAASVLYCTLRGRVF